MKIVRKPIGKIIAVILSVAIVSCTSEETLNSLSNNESHIIGAIDNSTPTSQTENRSSDSYGGEEIFRGLFFFQNEIPDGIPQLANIKEMIYNNPQSNEVDTLLTEIANISIQFANVNYPNFFEDLEAAIYSNNLYQISNAMDLSADIINQALLSSDEYSILFSLGEDFKNNETLRNQIAKLDLTKEEDQQKLIDIIEDHTGENISNLALAIPIFVLVVAVAIFYVGVAAVSIAVAAYSVVTKAAYWEWDEVFKSHTQDIGEEMLIAEIGRYFNPV